MKNDSGVSGGAVRSFAPIAPRRPRVLIVGSMPGAESLRQRRYYAHPRNAFWPLMATLCGFANDGRPPPYAERIRQIKRAGFALWDVLRVCRRRGSLDSAIIAESEIANDIAAFLQARPTILAVAANGGKARAAYQRHIAPQLGMLNRPPPRLLALPSTSPANAVYSFADKCAAWQSALAPFLPDSQTGFAGQDYSPKNARALSNHDLLRGV